jgi:hypothetical protein
MKVSELTGSDLDYWVALAQGWVQLRGWWYTNERCWVRDSTSYSVSGIAESPRPYTPSTNGQQCMELIEKFIQYHRRVKSGWCAVIKHDNKYYGSTPQEAICRAVVASVYGDTVPDKGE